MNNENWLCKSCGAQPIDNKSAECVRCLKEICEACQSWCDSCDETRCLACAATAKTACACAAQRYWEHSIICASDKMNFGAALNPQEFLQMESENAISSVEE